MKIQKMQSDFKIGKSHPKEKVSIKINWMKMVRALTWLHYVYYEFRGGLPESETKSRPSWSVADIIFLIAFANKLMN
jgi:hypothetical protein